MDNQLTITQKNFESPTELVRQALLGNKIASAPIEDLALAVSGAIEKGCFYLGLNKSSEDRSALKALVIEDCQRSFKFLTLSEIKLAIDNGVRGQYGEVRGMAPRDVYHWISSFQKDGIRVKAMKEITEVIDPWTPSEQDQIKLAMYTLESAWFKFKETGSYNDHANTVYNILNANKKIDLTTEEKNSCLAQAKAMLMNYYAPEKHLGNDIKMKEMMVIYNQIKAEDSNIRTITQAKQLGLILFFNKLLERKEDIYTLFKNND